MQQHQLHPAPRSTKNRKRIGRGLGSGRGAFSTRGVKGQKARTGKKLKPWFEGGQTPLHRRLPKFRGFTRTTRIHYQAVNLEDLASFGAGATITKEQLVKKGFIKNTAQPVKILGGTHTVPACTISAEAISLEAKKRLEAAGGTFNEIGKKHAGQNSNQ